MYMIVYVYMHNTYGSMGKSPQHSTVPGRGMASGPIRILRKWGAISIGQRRPKSRPIGLDLMERSGKVNDLEFHG